MPHPRQSIGGEKSIAMDIDQTYRPALARRRQRRPAIWNISDLLLIVDLAILLPILVLLPLSWLRVPLGLALVLFAPGYVLTEAIFPRRHEIGGVTRAALSFGLSAVTLPLLALVLSALPWGIRPWPMVLSLSLWVVLLCGIEIWAVDANKPDRRALVRQAGPMSLAPGQRLEQPVSWRMPWAGDDQMVELFMFMGDSPTPYRQLRLWLNVHE